MKKLLFVINTLGLAGAEKALVELLRAIDATRYDVSLYVMLPCGEVSAELPDTVRVLNPRLSACPVTGAEGRRVCRDTLLRAALRRGTGLRLLPYLLRNHAAQRKAKRVQWDKLLWRVLADGAPRLSTRYDLAVAYLEGASTYYVARHVHAARKVAFVHIDYQDAGYTPLLDEGCYDAFDRVCVVSDDVGKRFLGVYPQYAAKVKLFHNLVNAERIRQKAAEDAGFTDGFAGTRLLSVGRLHPQKAYDIAIPAMRRLLDDGYDLRWYVLGEGAERERLEKLIDENDLRGRFVLLGAVNNPYPFMREADIYMHVTRFEGKSIAIEEAQALGKPIIASDCTGNREQITNETDGLLIPLDVESVVVAVERLLRDPALRERLAQATALRHTGQTEDVQALLALAEGESPC